MTLTAADLPPYTTLMYPVLRAVEARGGSASGREITDQVIESCAFSDDQLAVMYSTREKSVLIDRVDWARSYCKLAGVLDSPARSLYLLSPLGHTLLKQPEDEARAHLLQLDRAVRSARPTKPKASGAQTNNEQLTGEDPPIEISEDPENSGWDEMLLARLHRLSPGGFEEFCMYLLRLFGMELERRGGSGDEGIDGLGTAPLTEVLSATVAVQVKRYDPASSVSRDVVALFQRDAAAVGAERAVMITLGRFTAPARKAASSATPHVDLIDGQRLCELMLAKQVGISNAPVVNPSWFDRFDQ